MSKWNLQRRHTEGQFWIQAKLVEYDLEFTKQCKKNLITNFERDVFRISQYLHKIGVAPCIAIVVTVTKKIKF